MRPPRRAEFYRSIRLSAWGFWLGKVGRLHATLLVSHAAFALASGEGFGAATLAGVAQLVEQLIRNQQVDGSSPFAGSIFLKKTY